LNNYSILLLARDNDNYSNEFTNYLRKLNSDVVVSNSTDKLEIENLFKKWEGDFIFLFRSRNILSVDKINKASIAAINFHPGPPNYRGSGCVNYALLNDENKYGCTAHIINAQIDDGPIIAVSKFPIHKSDDLSSLLEKSHAHLLELAKSISLKVISNPKSIDTMISNQSEVWSGPVGKLKDIDSLMELDVSDNQETFNRKIRALAYGEHKPFIVMHEKKFLLED
jgi:methionyl-tRNA formyltransferase